MRAPVSVQVLLGGRLRPFVCARDVALELLRRGLGDIVRRVEESRGAPVVLEFAGPSARLLSVGERSVMASLAPQVGAAAALFVSDERTEVFLRDQRRSKAHRALAPDPGAPCEEVVNVDLGAVDPLLLDPQGQVRVVRDLAGQPVTQALLGGDSGATLARSVRGGDPPQEQASAGEDGLPARDAFAADARGARRCRCADGPHRDGRTAGRAGRARRHR